MFSALFHHLGVDRLRESYGRLKPKAAAGVDGIRWQDYDRNLEGTSRTCADACIVEPIGRSRRGRVYIPKTDGRERPLGIAALEDKIVQGAAVRLLEAIYENDFMGFSYGFRPGSNPH